MHANVSQPLRVDASSNAASFVLPSLACPLRGTDILKPSRSCVKSEASTVALSSTLNLPLVVASSPRVAVVLLLVHIGLLCALAFPTVTLEGAPALSTASQLGS